MLDKFKEGKSLHPCREAVTSQQGIDKDQSLHPDPLVL